MLESYLLENLSSLLQIPVKNLDVNQYFTVLLDSLMAIILKKKIESDLQLQVSLNQFLGEQNINTLSTELLNQLALSKLITKEAITTEEREILSL
ncbi:acyl carrier protein [Anabaena sp. CCAP 1446/1C]|nr:acyl carrier protein [Anabaena cylindrica]MCM2406780.1 acyl carrier protein [Anabaena sp. CCAP 1446/1C]